MTLKQRISAFVQLGLFINRHASNKPLSSEIKLHEGLDEIIEVSHLHNNWFTPAFIKEAIINLSVFLDEHTLVLFTSKYKEKESKTIALICAGNIPLVCFHDLLCVLLSGNKVLIKLSSDDDVLVPFFLKLLTHYEPLYESQLEFASGRLSNFDAIIATGSNNTASHLNYYFGKYPNIIRKSRTSIAILKGDESNLDLKKLGKDIFQYFGLGCRNVNKLFVPRGYSFNLFFESIISYGEVINNKKYGNNYDYHRAIYLLESMPFLDNNFVMLKESSDLHSPVGVIYFQYYDSELDIESYLNNNQENIQCIVGQNYIPFGYSQQPVITEFADKINTLEFLVNL